MIAPFQDKVLVFLCQIALVVKKVTIRQQSGLCKIVREKSMRKLVFLTLKGIGVILFET